MCLLWNPNLWAWEEPGMGKPLVGFLVQAVLFWALLILVESRVLKFTFNFQKQKKRSLAQMNDSDVIAEANRIRTQNMQTLMKTDAMVVKNVTKKYGRLTAVSDVSFAVKRGECFGILGVNGAGKTTTFKMITGLEKITSGSIVINGNDVGRLMNSIYKDIGYCPQFDGLIDTLTGRETLKIISRIRGIKEHLIDHQIEALARLLFFEKHIDQAVRGYSGGTKRKLSFAIVSTV